MSVSYFKRFRMEIDLRLARFEPGPLPPGYRLVPWHEELLGEHAEAKYHSFRQEIDADVFNCLSEYGGCFRLMEEISQREGFLPEATWLAVFDHGIGSPCLNCGTIQGIRASHRFGSIQNVGITPAHRGIGLGTAMVRAALAGFQQAGLPFAYLEVTAQNERAVQLYKRLGFRRTKTLYKAVEMAFS
jgi:GNAT superfamily N-acetyltransferase